MNKGFHRRERRARREFFFFSAISACSAVIISLTLAALFFIAPTLAQGNEPTDDEVNAIAKQLYCPVCENTPLDVCPTQACTQWRATIKEKLALGWNEQQIKDYFVQQYGMRVLAAPPAQGFTIFVWILPPIAFLAGAAVLAYYLRSLRHPAPAPAAAPPSTKSTAPESDDEYAKRLEAELNKRR